MDRCGAKANSCLEACRVGVDVAREFGHLAEPVPVAVRVEAGKQQTVVPGPPGTPVRLRGYAGHLILYFPTAGTMADLTADQFHDPRRGLLVRGPVVAPMARHRLTEGFDAVLSSGTVIGYRERAEDASWRTMPAWAQPSTLVTLLAVKTLRDAAACRHPRRRRS